MLNTNPLQEESEIEPYLEFKKDKLFDVTYDIFDYCRNYSPLLLQYGKINDVIDILSSHIDFTNPFILVDDDISSDDDDIEEN